MRYTMLINVKQLFSLIGERREIDYELDLSEYELYESKPFIAPVKIKGEVENRAGIVTARLNVSFILSLSCDRCLTEYKRDYSFDLCQTLVRDQPRYMDSLEWEENHYVVEGDELDLDEMAKGHFLLHLPTKQLCKPECKGICQECGVNLNEQECDCDKI
ncbi:MAG TPA: DUF177 domain-containing protein [Oscillospiraceae bacterium]|nr:DUF177 domain-containing protein [Oscillospiraceae bacterium]